MDGAGEALISLADLAMTAFYSLEHSVHITAEDTNHCKENTFAFGCCFAEVEVDIPVGKVRVLRIVNVHDSGKLINPALAEAQVHGGMSMGIGYALTEEMKFDPKTGRLLNGNLLDYKMPTSMDHPELTALFVETSDFKDMSDDKRSAYDTLYTCLMTVTHLLAPFAPFVSDELYHDLGGQLESIHLDRWPKADEARIDADLEARMDMAQKITSMVLALRRKVNIKVRQPLAQIMVPAIDEEQRRHIEAVAALIKSEVNVKELNFVEGEGLLVKKVKCNFRVMGKKFGKLMKGVAAKMNTLSQAEIAQLEREGSIGFEVEGQPISVDATDVEIISEDMPGWLVSNEGNLTVALEVELTDDLRREGMARELINRIQNLRKESGLEITDRIVVSIDPHKETDEALETFGDLVRQQVLANEIVVKPTDGDEIDLGDFTTHIAISKA